MCNFTGKRITPSIDLLAEIINQIAIDIELVLVFFNIVVMFLQSNLQLFTMVFIHKLLLGVGDLRSFKKSLVLQQSLLQTIVDLLSLLIKSLVVHVEIHGLSVRMLMTFFAEIKPFNYGGLVYTSEYYVTNLLHCEHSGLFEAHRVEVLLVRHISTFKFRELWHG